MPAVSSGFAWAVGALAALEDEEGFDSRDVEMCVGTSAGSILAALLGCGVRVEVMVRHQRASRCPVTRHRLDTTADSGGRCRRCRVRRWARRDLLAPAARHPCRCRRWPRFSASAARPRDAGPLRRSSPGAQAACRAGPGPRWPPTRRRGSWRWTTTPASGCRSGGRRADGDAGGGGHRVVLDPRVVRAGRDRRAAVRRRRHLLVDLARPAGRPRPGRGVRAGADGVVRVRPAGVAGRPGWSGAAPGGDPAADREARRCGRRYPGDDARARAGGSGGDRRQPDGPRRRTACSRPRCGPGPRRSAGPGRERGPHGRLQ